MEPRKKSIERKRKTVKTARFDDFRKVVKSIVEVINLLAALATIWQVIHG